MSTATRNPEHSTPSTADRETTGAVTSRDGTTIGYRQFGHGPGLVMLHGAMQSSASHTQLATALADAFTVYLPDRRGRGRSGPAGAGYGMQREVADLDALLSQSGARFVFGVSSGGLIALGATRNLPAITRVAVYEPALVVDGSIAATALLERYDREMAQGKVASALVTGMRGAQMGPPIFNVIPRWLLERLTTMAMASEDKQAAPGTITMRALAPTLHEDFTLVAEMRDSLARFGALQTPVLLLGGSKSPAYLRTALDALERTLPQATRVVFPGLDHGGASNRNEANRGGQPNVVAPALRRFFA